MSPPIAWSGPEELETVQRHGIKLLIWIINRAMHLQSRNGNTIRISDSEMLGNRRTLNRGAPGLILLATREAAVTIAERLGKWLQQNRGAYCDDCIARELQLPQRQQANRASNSLATISYFYRDRGTCSICGAEKKVIEAL
jgi:hypothetical protein